MPIILQENPHQDGARLVDPDLKMDFLYAVHDALKELVSARAPPTCLLCLLRPALAQRVSFFAQPTNIHKSVLKSMINAIVQESLV